MKLQHTLLISLVSACLMACSSGDVDVEIDDQEATAVQLADMYEACQDESITSIRDLEDVINSGGNGLSKECRTAIFNFDLKQLINNTSVAFNIDIELPEPGEDVNPFEQDPNRWFQISDTSDHDLTDGTAILISTIDTNADYATLVVEGIDESGEATRITNFEFVNDLDELLTTNYIIDYSGSMLSTDLQATSRYLTQWNSILNGNINSAVYRFSDQVEDQLGGFSNNEQEIEQALSYDPNYVRGSTSLYDAIGLAFNKSDSNTSILLNVIVSDGADNSSVNFDLSAIQALTAEEEVYTIVIAGGFVDLDSLNAIVGDNGLVIFRYQIDEMDDMLQPLFDLGENMRQLVIFEDISGYSSIAIKDSGDNELLNIGL